MRDVARAVIQLACETTIYACNRTLEQLRARRPHIDDPLPAGHHVGHHVGPLLSWTQPPDDTATIEPPPDQSPGCLSLAADTRGEHTWIGKFDIKWTADPDTPQGWIGRHHLLEEPIRVPPQFATDPYGPFRRA